MEKRTATIANQHGIHCRPSALIVKECENYSGRIQVGNMRGESGDVSSIMQILSLALMPGDTVGIEVEGPDEVQMADHLVELFQRHFDFPS